MESASGLSQVNDEQQQQQQLYKNDNHDDLVSPQLPQPPPSLSSYTYLCSEQLDEHLQYNFVQNQLVWVLKSKGRRRRGRLGGGGDPSTQQPPEERTNVGASTPNGRTTFPVSSATLVTHETNDELGDCQAPESILELFLRARIVEFIVDKDTEEEENSMQNHSVTATTSTSTSTSSTTTTTTTTTTTSIDPSKHKNNNARHKRTVRVQYPRGSTYCVARDHLLPIFDWNSFDDDNTVVVGKDAGAPAAASHRAPPNGWIVAAPETAEYRRLCVRHTWPGEAFVEIGCDRGHCVQRVWQASSGAAVPSATMIGIDKATDSIQHSRSNYPHLSFVQWDILEDASIPPELDGVFGRGERSEPYGVLAIDLNGSRALPAVLEALSRIWRMGWQPRLIIVKARSLHAHLQQRQQYHSVRAGIQNK